MEKDKMMESMKKKSDAIDFMLEIMGGREDAPIEMRIMYLNRQADKIFKDINIDEKFMELPDESEIKQSLLTLEEKRLEILKQLRDKLNQQ